MTVVVACGDTVSGTALPNLVVATSLSQEHASSSAAATSVARMRATRAACMALSAYDDAAVTAYNAMVDALNAGSGWSGANVDTTAAAAVTAIRNVADRISTALAQDADQMIANLLRDVATKYRAEVDLIIAHGTADTMNAAKDAAATARDTAMDACDKY
ncbi:hypothetical protein AB0N05_33465 [Nocardia sp. NPDC051030]|uniref:hypothetical protein n=1 Tax=Nocardia sp. NPDC051030 TaxID=3155162 RepID=UPI0034450DAB